jgi:hypothetical protein
MKDNKSAKIMKRLLTAMIIALVIIILAFAGIGNYFVNYAIVRTGDGGERVVKNTDVVEVANADDEAQAIANENIIEKNKQEQRALADKWVENTQTAKVEVTAQDGITLRGTEYLSNTDSQKWVIVLHGYHSNPQAVEPVGMHFAEKGYNVLIPSMRASNESDGKYIGMGWLDKDDLKCWINLIVKENPNAQIVLHGSSMGAATVLMASGDELASNVKAIIEDSGYTSVWEIFASEAKARFNLPSFPVLNAFQVVAKIRAHYDIKEASALEQVKKSTTPILFIHGDQDDFVPESMCEKLYQAATCKKEKLVVQGAGHTESRYKAPELYYNAIFNFLEDNM